jgi:cation:H+ antiporter
LLNISELIIGLTIIAIGTSLPELAATISAVLKKKTDMVVGNVIGSNVLNITLVVPIIGIFSSVQLEEVLFARDYFTMLIATLIFVLVVGLYSSKNVSILLIRLLGVLFVASYLGYVLNLSNLI